MSHPIPTQDYDCEKCEQSEENCKCSKEREMAESCELEGTGITYAEHYLDLDRG